MEDIAGQALRVHPHEHARLGSHLTVNERDMLVSVHIVSVADDAPHPGLGGESRFGNAMHQTLGLKPVRDELRDGDEGETVFMRETIELRPPRARAVFAQDLADYTGGCEPGEASQIDSRLGMSHPLKHSAFARAQRGYVAGTAQIRGNRLR